MPPRAHRIGPGVWLRPRWQCAARDDEEAGEVAADVRCADAAGDALRAVLARVCEAMRRGRA